MITEKLNHYFLDYATYHRTKGNQLTHYVGVPMIVLSLLGILSRITFQDVGLPEAALVRIDGGTLLWMAAILWALFLDWKITIPYSMAVLGLYYTGRSISLPMNVGIFIVGWVIQLVGHIKYEKNRPALLKNLLHIFIGPMWIFSKLVGYGKTAR